MFTKADLYNIVDTYLSEKAYTAYSVIDNLNTEFLDLFRSVLDIVDFLESECI